jgi:hypothetical protein
MHLHLLCESLTYAIVIVRLKQQMAKQGVPSQGRFTRGRFTVEEEKVVSAFVDDYHVQLAAGNRKATRLCMNSIYS